MDLATSFVEITNNSSIYSAIACLVIYCILQNIKSTRILRLLKNQDSKQITPKKFKELVQYNFYLRDLIKHTLESLKASRIMIVLYHNGEHSIGGYSFSKMSCVQEVVSSKANSRGQLIPPVIKDFISIPVSAFSYITKNLFEKGAFTINNISALRDTNNSTYEELKKHKAKSAKFYPLVDYEDHIFGFVCFEFTNVLANAPKQSSLDIEETCVKKISSVLELMTRESNGKIKKA